MTEVAIEINSRARRIPADVLGEFFCSMAKQDQLLRGQMGCPGDHSINEWMDGWMDGRINGMLEKPNRNGRCQDKVNCMTYLPVPSVVGRRGWWTTVGRGIRPFSKDIE